MGDRGIFITIEGSDGSGKSTQIKFISNYFADKKREYVLTREPGGTAIGEQIRTLILDRSNSEMNAVAEAFLYAASRAQHVAQIIKPALEQGKIVICDRFLDSSIAYQGYGRGLGESVEIINKYAVMGCMPDITFLMELNPEVSSSRIEKKEKDRLEVEKIEFHREVFRGYMELSKRYPDRIVRIDAGKSINEISVEIRKHLDRLQFK